MKTDGTETSVLKDYGWTILIAVVVAFCIRFFVIEAYRIPGTTMHPTLDSGDTIFVAKWPFGLRWPGSTESFTKARKPTYGEVVIYYQPTTYAAEVARESVRRVVGLGGDTFEFRDGMLILNDKATIEGIDPKKTCNFETLPNGTNFETCLERPLLENYPKTKIPEDQVLVLGDLRTQWSDHSKKYKNWHMVPIRALKAKALWIWLSVEPKSTDAPSGWFSRIRFERMFRTIK